MHLPTRCLCSVYIEYDSGEALEYSRGPDRRIGSPQRAAASSICAVPCSCRHYIVARADAATQLLLTRLERDAAIEALLTVGMRVRHPMFGEACAFAAPILPVLCPLLPTAAFNPPPSPAPSSYSHVSARADTPRASGYV